MAWPKTQTAEEILGMKPEDLKAKLDSAATKEEVAAVSSTLTDVQGTLKTITASLANLTTKPAEVPPPDPNADDPDAVKLLSDPKKFVRGETQDIRDTSMQTTADLQEMRARTQFGPVFAQYGDELMKLAKNFNLAQRAQPNFWDFHIRTVLGDKFVKGELKGTSYPSLLGPSSVAPRSDDTADTPEQHFNPEVDAFLKARKVPLDKALRIDNLMRRDGEPITHANYFGSARPN